MTRSKRFRSLGHQRKTTTARQTHSNPFGRHLRFEPLEDRHMLAVVFVTNDTDVSDGDTSTIADLINDQGADGGISLREAIEATENTLGKDTIRFQMPATITLELELDSILDPVVIDATTMDGYDGVPLVTINGTNIQNEMASGLKVFATDTQIRGLSLFGFWSGISLRSNGNTVADSYLGILPNDGTQFGNKWAGGRIVEAFDNVIENNVISRNSVFGIEISGGGRNKVLGNLIGTAADGLKPRGNGKEGVGILNSSNNQIGGFVDEESQRNIISGNLNGVVISADTGVSQNNKVQGNYIGTDVSGKQRIPNLGDGIQLWNLPGAPVNAVSNNLIGGDDDDDGDLDGNVRYRNIISANALDGVSLFGSQVKPNLGA